MRHRANPGFWHYYAELPEEIQRLADENYKLLKADPKPSITPLQEGWQDVVGQSRYSYRAVAVEDGSDIFWFWIGHHSEYDRIISGRRK